MEEAGKTAYIATFVDKTTKLLMATVMPNKAVVRAFRRIPDEYLKTVMVDKGADCKFTAFAEHKALAQALGCDMYFAHP